MAIIKEERIGGQRLILGDCLDVMPLLGRFDAVVTDPPYGINAGKGIGRADRVRIKGNEKDWDKFAFVPNDFFMSLADHYIIWGGNYFDLPPSRGFLIWFKNNSGRDFADCEMAWSNQDSNARLMTFRPMNMDGGKQHPTQKPISIMEWSISYLPYSKSILDPFMGSGTTLIACQRMGRQGTGIELDPEYFDIACKRVEEASNQPDLFIEPVKQAVQEALF